MGTPLKQGFATYPSVQLHGYKTDAKTKKKKFGVLKQLLFGDYIKPEIENGKYVEVIENKKSYIKVRARNATGYILPGNIQKERVFELNFVDIGQGDGCHIVTPEDKHFIVDAGPGDNMYRFLKWRFNLKNAKLSPPPFTAVITHSDLDHYKGFGLLFANDKAIKNKFSFNKVYHNGLVEASGTSPATLGTVVSKNGQDYVTDLCDTNAAFNKRAKAVGKPGTYITTLNKTTAAKEALREGMSPIYNTGNTKIEVLGPVSEKVAGKAALPVFESNKGKTKNGHSIVLRITVGKLRLMLGGDLNIPAEDHLLGYYSGVDVADLRTQLRDKNITPAKKQKLEKQMDAAIIAARKYLEADIAKSCHHGSADFTSEFLRSVNALATVISSGDDEPHCHPRPDTLGTIGKHCRGQRSLIFCTELARSGKEFIDLTKLPKDKKKERAVTVYGMINVRTDGEKVIIAQKLERPAAGRNWDIHKLEWNNTSGEFEYNQYLKY